MGATVTDNDVLYCSEGLSWREAPRVRGSAVRCEDSTCKGGGTWASNDGRRTALFDARRDAEAVVRARFFATLHLRCDQKLRWWVGADLYGDALDLRVDDRKFRA